MYILERKIDTKGIVGVHIANIQSTDEWQTNEGVEVIEITKEAHDELNSLINQNGLTKPRYAYDETQGIIDN